MGLKQAGRPEEPPTLDQASRVKLPRTRRDTDTHFINPDQTRLLMWTIFSLSGNEMLSLPDSTGHGRTPAAVAWCLHREPGGALTSRFRLA